MISLGLVQYETLLKTALRKGQTKFIIEQLNVKKAKVNVSSSEWKLNNLYKTRLIH